MVTSTRLHADFAQLDLQQVPANASSLNSQEQLDATLARLRKARESVAKEITGSNSKVENFRERLAREDADPALSRGFLRVFSEKTEQQLTKWNGLLRVLDHNLELVALLSRTWGRWKYDPEARSFAFSDVSELQAFDASMQKLLQAADQTSK